MRLFFASLAVVIGLACSCVFSSPDTVSDTDTAADTGGGQPAAQATATDADSEAKPSPADAFPEGTVVATNRDGEAVAVAALDAENNPYRGQYGPWDEWVYEHYARDFDPSKYVGG